MPDTNHESQLQVEAGLRRQVVGLTVALQRLRSSLEANPDGHDRHDNLRTIRSALGLFGASHLAVERWEQEFGNG